MSDTIAKLRELLLHRSKAGMLRGLLDQEQQQSSPTWNGMLGGLAGAPSELPYKGTEMTPERIRNGLSGLVDMTPVVGDIKSGIEGVQAAREGDWAGAGLGMLGALPFVPGMAGVTKMAPEEFLRLAAPFGVGGSRQMSRATVDFMKKKGDVSGAYLTVKESPNGLQVGLHDGRHRAIAAKEMGVPFEVDVRKGQRMSREHPEMSQDDLLMLIKKQGGLLPEY